MIKSSLTPPSFDQAAIDHYVAKGRRARAQAIAEFFRAIFGARAAQKPVARQLVRARVTAA
ncbi:MAG: hypothetical protein AAGH68_14915 [Pseudomonadota bacterium]